LSKNADAVNGYIDKEGLIMSSVIDDQIKQIREYFPSYERQFKLWQQNCDNFELRDDQVYEQRHVWNEKYAWFIISFVAYTDREMWEEDEVIVMELRPIMKKMQAMSTSIDQFLSKESRSDEAITASIDQVRSEESRSTWRETPPSMASYDAALAQSQAASASQ